MSVMVDISSCGNCLSRVVVLDVYSDEVLSCTQLILTLEQCIAIDHEEIVNACM